MIKEVTSTLLLLATVAIVIAAATIYINKSGVIYHEKSIGSIDPTSRELNMLPIRGR